MEEELARIRNEAAKKGIELLRLPDLHSALKLLISGGIVTTFHALKV